MFVGLLVAVWFHAKEQERVWVWISVGIVCLDRVARYAWAIFVNLSVLHKSAGLRPFWTHQALLNPLPGNVTKVTINNPRVTWRPCQAIFLTCHAIAPFQSHPFTIASLPEDQRIEFLVRAEKGATKRLLRYAKHNDNQLGLEISASERARTVLLEGPYGTIRPLGQFDTVLLIAGGMGATFTVPLLRDLIARLRNDNTRHRLTVTSGIRFVWAIKSHEHIAWFDEQLQAVLLDADTCRSVGPWSEMFKEVEVSIYLTGSEDQGQGTELDVPCASVQCSTEHACSEPITPTYDVGETATGAEKDAPPTMYAITASQTQPSSHNEQPTSVENQGQTSNRREPKDSTVSPLKPIPGRPPLRKIIGSALENATGESAVVVCGPESLSDDVRRSTVSLSDERAVHKGTGAQGVFLHVEDFGW